jgi:hypothetical protein
MRVYIYGFCNENAAEAARGTTNISKPTSILLVTYLGCERGWDGVDWIDLAQDRDQWSALVNMVMNFRVP